MSHRYMYLADIGPKNLAEAPTSTVNGSYAFLDPPPPGNYTLNVRYQSRFVVTYVSEVHYVYEEICASGVFDNLGVQLELSDRNAQFLTRRGVGDDALDLCYDVTCRDMKECMELNSKQEDKLIEEFWAAASSLDIWGSVGQTFGMYLHYANHLAYISYVKTIQHAPMMAKIFFTFDDLSSMINDLAADLIGFDFAEFWEELKWSADYLMGTQRVEESSQLSHRMFSFYDLCLSRRRHPATPLPGHRAGKYRIGVRDDRGDGRVAGRSNWSRDPYALTIRRGRPVGSTSCVVVGFGR